MYCSKCGKELEEGVKFCSGCGARMEGATVETKKEEKPKESSTKAKFDIQKFLKPKNIIITCIVLVLVIGGCVFGKWYSERWYRALLIVEDYHYDKYYTGDDNYFKGKDLGDVSSSVVNYWIVHTMTYVNKNIPVKDEINNQFDTKSYKDIVAEQVKVTKSDTDEFVVYFVFGCNSSKKNIAPVPIGILYEENGKYIGCLEGKPEDIITIMYDWHSYLNALYEIDYKNTSKEDWYESNILPSSEYASDNVLKAMIQKAEGGASDSILTGINANGTLDQEVAIGESVELATIRVKVLSCNEYSSLRTKYTQTAEAAPSGSKYVVFEVEVENITGSTMDDWSLDLNLIDDDERIYERYEKDYHYTDDNLDDIQLSPNVRTVGYLIYNVPNDCTGYYLYVNKAGTNQNFKLMGN